MAAQLNISGEFATLVDKVHQYPDDSLLKQKVVRRLPEMRALAQKNPLAMYHLAQVYSPASPQYKEMMTRSADMGCTNAMLAVCQLLLKSHSAAHS